MYVSAAEAAQCRAAWRPFREQFEGGWSRDDADHGNYFDGTLIGSNHGVTPAVLAQWLGREPTADDMERLSWEEADAIADAFYWLPAGGDVLPPGINLIVADFGWTSGVQTATRMLQRALGFGRRDVDGIVGGMTNLAARGAPVGGLISDLHARQGAYYASLGQLRFLAGWERRNDARRDLARKLAGVSP